MNQYFRLEFIIFFFNTVTIWVLIYFLINRCTGITVKWVLHTCTSIRKNKRHCTYTYINTCYVFTCTSAATAMHIQGCNIVLQKSFEFVHLLFNQTTIEIFKTKIKSYKCVNIKILHIQVHVYTSLHQFENINRKYCIFLIFPSLLST